VLKLIKVDRIQHAADPVNNVVEAVEHDAYLLFHHPFGVIALLRERPRVAFDQHRKLADHGFGNAAGARLADQKVRSTHQAMDLLGKTDDVDGDAPGPAT